MDSKQAAQSACDAGGWDNSWFSHMRSERGRSSVLIFANALQTPLGDDQVMIRYTAKCNSSDSFRK